MTHEQAQRIIELLEGIRWHGWIESVCLAVIIGIMLKSHFRH